MIVGVGTDLVEIHRIEKLCSGDYVPERIFHANEYMLVAGHPQKAAGNFAVKEAVVKVFGTGFSGVEANEIEVGREENGKPYIKLHGNAKKMEQKLGIDCWHVSISNTKTLATAFVVGESRQTK
jgi:holo-[acyl-carrier protein] synthase